MTISASSYLRKENAMSLIIEAALFMTATGVLVFFLVHRRRRKALV
jgi:hypothetical protein